MEIGDRQPGRTVGESASQLCSRIHAHASVNEAATLAAIRAAEVAIAHPLPPMYVALLQCANGFIPRLECYSLLIYSTNELVERNATYEVAQYLPELIMIRDDGGGRGIFIAYGDSDSPVYLIGMRSMQLDDARTLASNLADWVNNTFNLDDPR